MSHIQHRNFHRTSIDFDWAKSPFIEDVDGISLIWGEGVSKVIIVGCDQGGKITIVKSHGEIKLKLSDWLNNPARQEHELEKVYKSPRKFAQIISTGGSDLYSERAGPGSL